MQSSLEPKGHYRRYALIGGGGVNCLCCCPKAARHKVLHAQRARIKDQLRRDLDAREPVATTHLPRRLTRFMAVFFAQLQES